MLVDTPSLHPRVRFFQPVQGEHPALVAVSHWVDLVFIALNKLIFLFHVKIHKRLELISKEISREEKNYKKAKFSLWV